MNRYKDLFFDLDHTLWDFEQNSRDTLEELFREFNLYALGVSSADHFIHEYKSINDKMWLDYRNGEIQKDELRIKRFEDTLALFDIKDPSLATRMAAEYVSICPLKTQLFPFTLEVLAYLKEKYRLHIITNGFEEIQHLKLQSSGLLNYFATVNTSEKACYKKPHRKMFEFCITEATANADSSLIIGDNLEADIIGARNYGMNQVYFNPLKRAHSEKVTFEINCLSELKELL